MLIRKFIVTLFLFFSFQSHVCCAETPANLAKFSEVELIQGLLRNELNYLNNSKVNVDNLSLEDTEKLFNQTLELCNDLKKDLSGLFKIWSTIKRNPVFENKIFNDIEILRKQLLEYKLSKGTTGKAISKEKLVNLVSLLKLYKNVKKEMADRANGSFVNKTSAYLSKALKNYIFWPLYRVSEFYTIKIAKEVLIFIAMIGVIHGTFFADNFILGFCKPFVGVIQGLWSYFFNTELPPLDCGNQNGLLGYSTCKTVEMVSGLLDFLNKYKHYVVNDVF